ncbi:hypothetical protein [Mesorhizobium sp. RIZ17]|uniref:hypothetical protein n=1 Tax=Mesorhizobium sp. RIZ17 TaxID=3132743 RepID=UPI003DA94038
MEAFAISAWCDFALAHKLSSERPDVGALSSKLLITFGDGDSRNGRFQKRDPGEEISG